MTPNVKEWTDEAFRTLEKARELSASAQNVLESTAHVLTDQLPKRVHVACEKMDMVKDQHANLAALVEHLRVKTTDSIIGNYQKNVQSRLDPALNDLDLVLSRLQHVSVPAILLNDKSTAGDKRCLGDFVSHEDIALLKGNIGVYKRNCEKAHGLLRERMDSLSEQHGGNTGRFSRLTKTYDSSIVAVELLLRGAAVGNSNAPRDASNLVKSILRENASLEQELVSLLQMLTNHYDQCTVATELLESGGPVADVNFDVLHADTMELQVVLKEFSAIHDIIMNNEARAAKFVDDKLPGIDRFISECDSLADSNRVFKTETITAFVLLLLRCEHVFRQCSVSDKALSHLSALDVYVSVVLLLCHHYTQFEAIFVSHYVKELHYEKYAYPRRFLEALHDFLNGPLLQLEEEERARRRQWLANYGDFIPRELQLPGEENQPRVLQVISEGLDQLHGENANDDEAQILALNS